MDSSLSTARIGAVPTPSVRADAQSAQAAIPTELGAARSVTATSGSSSGLPYDEAQTSRRDTASNVVIDPQTREVIYREISKRSGEVVDQIPGDAMLKLRAYFQEIAHPEASPRVEKIT
jgi:hypothetical protein